MLEWAAHPRTEPVSSKAKAHQTPDHQEQLDEIQSYCTARGLADENIIEQNFEKFTKLCQGIDIFNYVDVFLLSDFIVKWSHHNLVFCCRMDCITKSIILENQSLYILMSVGGMLHMD